MSVFDMFALCFVLSLCVLHVFVSSMTVIGLLCICVVLICVCVVYKSYVPIVCVRVVRVCNQSFSVYGVWVICIMYMC